MEHTITAHERMELMIELRRPLYEAGIVIRDEEVEGIMSEVDKIDIFHTRDGESMAAGFIFRRGDTEVGTQYYAIPPGVWNEDTNIMFEDDWSFMKLSYFLSPMMGLPEVQTSICYGEDWSPLQKKWLPRTQEMLDEIKVYWEREGWR